MENKHIFEKTIQEAHVWLKDICTYSKLDTQDKALIVLRVVLHEFRDNLTLKNMANLSAEFPLLIKGIFFESWKPADMALIQKFPKEKENYYFKESIAEKLQKYPEIHADEAILAVFKTIGKHIARGEVEKLRKILPPEILTYWFKATTER
jgi:uncharacterized protein (DUF2267 family)